MHFTICIKKELQDLCLLSQQEWPAGLYLPTSDMDLVIINSGCNDIERGLRALGKAMVGEGMARNVQVIPAANKWVQHGVPPSKLVKAPQCST